MECQIKLHSWDSSLFPLCCENLFSCLCYCCAWTSESLLIGDELACRRERTGWSRWWARVVLWCQRRRPTGTWINRIASLCRSWCFGILIPPAARRSTWWDPRTDTRSPASIRTCSRRSQSRGLGSERTEKKIKIILNFKLFHCTTHVRRFGVTFVGVFEGIWRVVSIRALIDVQLSHVHRNGNDSSAKYKKFHKNCFKLKIFVDSLELQVDLQAVEAEERNCVGDDPLLDESLAVELRNSPMSMLELRRVVEVRVMFVLLRVLAGLVVPDAHLHPELLQVVKVRRPSLL